MNEEMKTKLEKYMKKNGYYDTEAIRRDEGRGEHARFFDIFGDDDDQIETKSDMLEAAEAYNNQKSAEAESSEKAQSQQEADEVLSADHIDWTRAIKLGLAKIYGDVATPETKPYVELTREAQQRRNELIEDEDDDDEPQEVTRYTFGDETYIVYRAGNTYTVDAEWSDGPAAEKNAPFTNDEIEAIHRNWQDTVEEQDLFQRVEDEILNQVLTVAEIAQMFSITRDAVNKTCQRSEIPYRRSGNTLLIRRTDAMARWGHRKD